jgi:hypothetical protein
MTSQLKHLTEFSNPTGKHDSICVGGVRPVHLATQDRDLVTQHEDLSLDRSPRGGNKSNSKARRGTR